MGSLAAYDDRRINSKKARQEIVLEAIAAGALVEDACRLAGIKAGAYRSWRYTDPVFRARAQKARDRHDASERPATFGAARLHYFGMGTPIHQMRLVHALDELKPREITLVNLWPEAGKSTTMVDYVCWVLANDPDHRFTIVSKSQTLGEKLLGRIKRRMTDNRQFPAFIARYGPFYTPNQERDGKPWSATGITVAAASHDEADYSVEVRGWNSAAYGTRIDTLIIDDVQSIESVNHTDKILESLRQTYFTRGRQMRILIVGTRLAPRDIYERLVELDIIDRHINLPALDAHGKPTCPEWWTGDDAEADPEAAIATIRKQIGEDAFWASYQQQPNANELATFTDVMLDDAKDRLRSIMRVNGVDPVTIGIDPALGGGNAMVAAKLTGERLEVLDVSVDRRLSRVEEILSLLEDFALRYHPSRVIIEVNAFQRSLANDERLRGLARQYGFVTLPHQTGYNKIDAVLGVASMAGSFMRSEITFPWGDDLSAKRMTPLIDELRGWRPNVPSKLLVQDMVMALWFVWRDWMSNRKATFSAQGWNRGRLPWQPTAVALGRGN